MIVPGYGDAGLVWFNAVDGVSSWGSTVCWLGLVLFMAGYDRWRIVDGVEVRSSDELFREGEPSVARRDVSRR